MTAARKNILLLAALLPVLGACAVVAVTSTVVGAGVSVASTAVGAAVVVGKGAAHLGSAIVSDGN